MAELAPIVFEVPGEVERPRSRGRGHANEVVPIDRSRPEWLKVRLPTGPTYENLRRLMRIKELHTVCEEAHCPNMAECWGAGTATFMILGYLHAVVRLLRCEDRSSGRRRYGGARARRRRGREDGARPRSRDEREP